MCCYCSETFLRAFYYNQKELLNHLTAFVNAISATSYSWETELENRVNNKELTLSKNFVTPDFESCHIISYLYKSEI